MVRKTLKTLADFEQLKKGQTIFVSNGEKEPPKHHTRKHKTWSLRNYKGFVHHFTFSGGRYELAVDSTGNSVMVNCYGIDQCTFEIEA